jgi:hypothetical protein
LKIGKNALIKLLEATKREQSVNGKTQPQVMGCILFHDEDTTETVSMVKDGKTSLARFSVKGSEGESCTIPVPDIDRLIGVLKYHGDVVQLLTDGIGTKVVVKSKGKQTTLIGGANSKAFPHSSSTIEEWYGMSCGRLQQLSHGGTYTTADGQVISAKWTAIVKATDLYDALRCDGMNGQKLNRYTFTLDGEKLSVSVGDHFKGQTVSELSEITGEDFSVTLEGGLENVVKHYSNDVYIHFLDFREYEQGIRAIFSFDNGDLLIQAGVIE